MFFAIPKKTLIIFTTNKENVNSVILKEVQNYYESKDKLSNQRKRYYEKKEMCYLQSLN